MGYSDWRFGFPSGIDEAGDIDLLAKQIARMTDANDHNHARRNIATYMNNKKFINIFNDIIHLHGLIGSMPSSLGKFRDDMTNEMLEAFKQQFGEDSYKKIHSAL